MLKVDLLYIAGIDIVAAGYDHVLFTVDDIKIALFVHGGDIAGVQPAIPQGLGGILGFVQIPGHDLGAFDDQLAALSPGHVAFPGFKIHDADIGIGDGNADAADLAFAAGKGIDMGHGRCFGEPVAFHDNRTGFLFKLPDYFHR